MEKDYILKAQEIKDQLKGKLHFNHPLAKLTRFRVGGPAEIFFEPQDEEDLIFFLQQMPEKTNYFILGKGSNLLIRDGGIEGVVISLKHKNFSQIMIDGDHIQAGAGMDDLRLATEAAKAGLEGFSFLSGIPGNLGGALRMNAGAFGYEIKDIFVSAVAVDFKGQKHEISYEDMGFAYRHVDIPPDFIFLHICLKSLGKAPQEELDAQIKEIQEKRDKAQPKGAYTGGSTFANPKGYSAWKLIDEAGLRGYRLGGAQVSEMHTNFLINTGDATAADIENLGEFVRQKVQEHSGIKLRWEIRRVGNI